MYQSYITIKIEWGCCDIDVKQGIELMEALSFISCLAVIYTLLSLTMPPDFVITRLPF